MVLIVETLESVICSNSLDYCRISNLLWSYTVNTSCDSVLKLRVTPWLKKRKLYSFINFLERFKVLTIYVPADKELIFIDFVFSPCAKLILSL